MNMIMNQWTKLMINEPKWWDAMNLMHFFLFIQVHSIIFQPLIMNDKVLAIDTHPVISDGFRWLFFGLGLSLMETLHGDLIQ